MIQNDKKVEKELWTMNRKKIKKIKRICRRIMLIYRRQLTFAGLCLVAILAVSLCFRAIQAGNQADVYAASEEHLPETYDVPPGISGALTGVLGTKIPSEAVERIGTSCEEVIVGQRKRKIEAVSTMNASDVLKNAVSTLNQASAGKSSKAKMMSDTDYATLLSIVEAESGGEDLKGRIMVANVIMNRVSSDLFPDTVTEVVYEVSNGAAQFSPTEDGRISSVTVSETTLEAVKAALEGTDYSEGALFFVAKDQADKDNVKWFEKDLEALFEHGVHSFYTYPDLV